jgi:hypothetical protein
MTAGNLLPNRARLDAAGAAGFGDAVRSIVKHIVIASLFAVAMLGGGEVPILHAPEFAHAHDVAHAQMDHANPGHTHHDRAADSAAADQDESGSPDGTDRGCTHAHAHCCAATAILTANVAQAPIITLGLLHREREAALPYGQLSNPPLRPPRHIA